MVIRLNHLTYKPKGAHVPSLGNISTEITPGTWLLTGGNAETLSQLMLVIAGFLRAGRHQCLVDNTDTGLRLPSVTSRVVYWSPSMTLPGKTVEQLVRCHAQFYDTFNVDMLADNLQQLDIDPYMPFSQMAPQVLRKACVAYVMALQTPVVMLDNPCGDMQIGDEADITSLIARCRREDGTVIVAQGYVSDVDSIFDHVLLMDRSHLLLSASIADLCHCLEFEGPVAEFTSDARVLFANYRDGMWQVIRRTGTADGACRTLNLQTDIPLLYAALTSDQADAVRRAMDPVPEHEPVPESESEPQNIDNNEQE